MTEGDPQAQFDRTARTGGYGGGVGLNSLRKRNRSDRLGGWNRVRKPLTIAKIGVLSLPVGMLGPVPSVTGLGRRDLLSGSPTVTLASNPKSALAIWGCSPM